MVEILIGFSILLLATEYFFKHAFKFDRLFANFALSFFFLLPLSFFGHLQPLLLVGLAMFLTLYISITNHFSSYWLPLLITVFFGLIHGLGFASSIAEAGLPQDKLLPIILSFNLGVEAGQLAVAFVLLAVLSIAKTHLNFKNFNYLHGTMGVFVFSMGTFWFVSRAVGI